MRSTPLALLTAAGLCFAAPALAQNPDFTSPSNQPLPGLSEEADQQLWCAVMASQLAQVALQNGDQQTFQVLAPMAMALSKQISTTFVVLHVGEPDIRSYLDLYTIEISNVIAGTAPERYAPEQCKGIVAAMVMV
ncbi:MAG TPA: hypothetical protein VIN06_09135 [Devosia sp.]